MKLRALHVVEQIKPRPAGGYTVVARRLDPDQPGRSERCEVSGTSLVLSAGTVGSTELLLRAAYVDRTLPRLPAAIGHHFSPNGDMIFAGTLDADVDVDPSHGPSITVGASVNAPGSGNLITLQDLGFPPSLTSILDEVLPLPAKIRATGKAVASYFGALTGPRPLSGPTSFLLVRPSRTFSPISVWAPTPATACSASTAGESWRWIGAPAPAWRCSQKWKRP